MGYQIGDKIKIIRREGEGNIGTVTKISDTDPKFKYEITDSSKKKYWKEEASIEPFPGTGEVVKKRGRPKGKADVKKPTSKEKVVKNEVIKLEEICSEENPFLNRYQKFCSNLTFQEFLELRRVVESDYKDMMELIKEQFGFKA